MLKTLRSASCAALLAAMPVHASAADEPIKLEWEQLVPSGDRTQGPAEKPWGIVQHSQMSPMPDAAGTDSSALVTAYDGKRVRLPGFVVPLDFDDAGQVKEFLLVPYVGACIHVPPPPPNQIVHVQSGRAFEVDGMFEPVWVTGVLAATPTSTELAEVGYRIAAEAVTPYVEE